MIGRYSMIGSVVTAGALLLFVAQPGFAQRGGGGHGGGGHGGGGHGGGVSHGGGGSFHGGSGSWHGGNFHDGHFHDGHHNNFWGFGIGFSPWWGWGWPGYGWGGGYYGAGWYDYPWSYGNDYGGGYYAAPDYYGYQYAPSSYAAAPTSTQTLSANAAALRILVPADAKVWIEGQATKQQGPVRIFESPDLAPGNEYTYDIRAQWTEGGKQVERTKTVNVHAGDRLTVALAQAPSPNTAPMPREAR